MLSGDLQALFGQIGRVADVWRQIAQFTGELDAGGDAFALAECVHLGVRHMHRDLAQGHAGFLAAGRGVFVSGVIGGDHCLAHGPFSITAFHRKIAESQVNAFDRTAAQGAHGIGDGFQILRHGEFFRITQANHQHARRGDARHILQQQGLSGLAGNITAFGQGLQATTGGGVQCRTGRREGFVTECADHHAIAGIGMNGALGRQETQGHGGFSRSGAGWAHDGKLLL